MGIAGTGKTTVVQQLADLMGKALVVQNLSQQTESADIFGGFKPTNQASFTHTHTLSLSHAHANVTYTNG